MERRHEPGNDGVMKSKANIALFIFLIIAVFFLVSEHRAHLSGWLPYWPYLLLLACPAMHLFMHGGHGHGGHGSSKAPDESAREQK